MRATRTLLPLLALAACAADVPYRTDFDDSAGEVVVAVLGDGFVRTAGERVPLEAAVLTLRQRTRSLEPAVLAAFVVRLVAQPIDDSDEVAAALRADLDRLLGELQVMGVKQVRYL